jgi:hypothetical protein
MYQCSSRSGSAWLRRAESDGSVFCEGLKEVITAAADIGLSAVLSACSV